MKLKKHSLTGWTESAALALCLPLLGGIALGLDFTRSSWSICLLLVLAPLIEEVVFRWGLQEELLRSERFAALARRFTTVPGASTVITAFGFAVAHLAVNPSWMSAATFLPAWAIGALYARQRRLAPCVLAHAGFNLVWLWWHATQPAFS